MNKIERLKELEAKATKGPLHVEPWDGYEMKHQIIAPPVKRTTEWGQRESAELVFARCSKEGDAAFIVAARNAMPKLLAVVEAAKEVNDMILKPKDGSGPLCKLAAALKSLEAE